MARGAAHYQTVTRRDLSRRQREVLALIAAGKTNGEIAERLGITLDGAKWHVSEILGKLGVSSREEAAQWWASENSLGARIGSLARGLAPLASWKVAAPVAGIAVIAAGLFALLSRDDGDGEALAACTVDDVILEPVEAYGPDGPGRGVLIALTARSRGRDCTVRGEAGAWLQPTTSAAGTPSVSPVPIDTAIGAQRTPVVYLRWNDWCGPFGSKMYFAGNLRHAGAPEPFVSAGPMFVVERPPCSDPAAQSPSAPITFEVQAAPLSSFLPDLGPDPLDFVFCYPADSTSKWMKPCEAADRITPGLNSGNVDAAVAMLETREYTCPAPGSGGLGGPGSLCVGALPGEVRSGVPVAFHGSEGDVLSVEQLRARLLSTIESAKDGPLFHTRVATVACLAEACDRFALGIAIDGAPSAAYFVFETRGNGFAITNAGFAGDIALTLRRGGGGVRISAGDGSAEPEFVPLVPPY